MAASPSPKVLAVLRATLRKLQSDPDISQEDPVVQDFKRSVLRSVANLEIKKDDAA